MAIPTKKKKKDPDKWDATGGTATDATGEGGVLLRGWGKELKADGTYSDFIAYSATDLNNVFDYFYSTNDPRLTKWMKSVGVAGNPRLAKEYWKDAVSYTVSVSRQAGTTGVDFFKEAKGKDFKNLYLDIPKKYYTGSSTDPQVYVTLTDEDTARKDLADEMFNVAGRKPTEKEYKQYYNALNKAQQKNPTTVVNGVTTQSRFDEQDFLLRFVAKKVDFADIKPGQARSALDKIDLFSKEYGVDSNFSNSERRKLARQVLLGKLTDEALMQRMADTARKAFPAFADQITDTDTLRRTLSDYVGTYANLLEVNDNNVNLKDVIGKATLNLNGEYKPVSLFDFEKIVRKDPKFQYTKQAHQEAADFGRSFARAMGVNL